MPANLQRLFLLTLLAAMASGFIHSNLWGPDETRDAEIARETYAYGYWGTPHLCGMPFLEKPMLYYDLLALSFKIAGKPSPTAARAVSVALGGIMLAFVFGFGRLWGGARRGWLAVLLLAGMPKFFMYSHMILLDIAVGAFCTGALMLFGRWQALPAARRRSRALPYAFYLCCALAFLSKGIVALFLIFAPIGAYCLITRRWIVVRALLATPSLLVLILPFCGWVALLYREGGWPYLHEHFINNTIGRFLHIQFQLQAEQFDYTDVGQTQPAHYYLFKAPSMFGPSAFLLPLFAYEFFREGLRSARRRGRTDAVDLNPRLLLLCWALVPMLILSFSSSKDTSYVLPCYSAVALLASEWLDGKLPGGGRQWEGAGWLWLAAGGALYCLAFAGLAFKAFIALPIALEAAAVLLLLFQLTKRRWTHVHYLLQAMFLVATAAFYSPAILKTWRKCYAPLVDPVWSRVGDATLYLFKPNDTWRGAFAFPAGKTTPEIDSYEDLLKTLKPGPRRVVMIRSHSLRQYSQDPAFGELYEPIALPDLSDRIHDNVGIELIQNKGLRSPASTSFDSSKVQ